MERPMRYAYEIYRTKSFSKAAENLYISQPALSAIIRKLEDSLGTPLFDRSVKPVIPTPEGEYYIYCAEQIMNIEEGMRQYFEDIASMKKGNIAIGASSYFCSSILPDLLNRFRNEYPHIVFRLTEDNSTPQLKERLLTKEIDFAVSSNHYPPEEYDSLELGREEIILAVPSSSAVNDAVREYSYTYAQILEMLDQGFEGKKRVSIDHFGNEEFITIDRNSDLYPRILTMFRSVGITPSFSMHLQQMSSCYYMAAGQFGSAFLRSSTLRMVRDTGNLCFYLIDSPLSSRRTYLYYKKGGYLSKAMEALIVWLKQPQNRTFR